MPLGSRIVWDLKVDTFPVVVILPMLPGPFGKSELVNHRAPPGPAAILVGAMIPAFVKTLTLPPVVIRPIEECTKKSPLYVPSSANHNAPSGPAVMPSGPLTAGLAKLDAAPLVVIRPMVLLLLVNQRAPSGPAVMPAEWWIAAPVKVVMVPLTDIRPMEPARPGMLTATLVNHSAPSLPTVMEDGSTMLGAWNIRADPFTVILPIDEPTHVLTLKVPSLVNHRAPSGPAVIPPGVLIPGAVKSDSVPLALKRPIELLPTLVNQ